MLQKHKLRRFFTYFLLASSWGLHAKELPQSIIAEKSHRDVRDITPLLINENRDITPALHKLLQLTNIECDSFACCLDETQKNWIAVLQGKNGKERRDLTEPQEYIAIKPKVLQIAAQMGLMDAQLPLLKHYDYALCLGAFMETARSRLASLIDAWKNGIRFDELVFLGSDRPLRTADGQNEDFARLCDQSVSPLQFRPDWIPPNEEKYKTEFDMLKQIWDQADIPTDMKRHLDGHVIFVFTPAPSTDKRASTRDTYLQWIKDHSPAPGTVLATSSPVLWSYQHLVGRNALGDSFYLDTIAPEVKDINDVRVIIILDTIAKCIYSIKALPNQ